MSVSMNSLASNIRKLIEQHKKLKRNGKLLFAGWYNKNNNDGDVNLFEVFEDFPDPGVGKLETFPFPSTSDFPIAGSLRLTVTSPSELHSAFAQNDTTLAQILASDDKEVIYPEDSDWEKEITRLVR